MHRDYTSINPFAHPINFVYQDGRQETGFLTDITFGGRMRYKITRIRERELPRGIQKARNLDGFINAVSSVRTPNPEKIRITIYGK